jgi:hypothetical protein
MSGVQGPTPEVVNQKLQKKGKAQQMVSRDDLIKAVQQMQLPGHQPQGQGGSQQVYPPTQVWGTNG